MKNRIKNLSIKRINLILFFLMFSSVILFINYHKTELGFYFLTINLFLLFLFLFFNYFYTRELEETKRNIKDIITSNTNKLLVKKHLYKENKENNSLFNNILINNNLIKKDYKDLEKVLFTFSSEYFINELSEKGRERIALWVSITKYAHVMFLDIIWFTNITERLTPERALLLLNIYFDWIVEIIKNHNWFIDKFLWDWLLAVFVDEKSNNSLKASLEIQKYIKNFKISEIGKNISIWIGINSWDIIIWTVWSKNRMEVTVIWDIVNTASRIEWLTRNFKEKIIISKETYDAVKGNNNFSIKYLGEKILKWKKTKKKIYSVEKID